MINKVSLVAEILAALVCLYALYGEKFRPGFKEVMLIAFEIVVMQSIDDGLLPEWSSELMFLVIAFYCAWRFGTDKKKLIVNNVLYIILLGGLQMICFSFILWIVGEEIDKEMHILAINAMLLMICIVLSKRNRLEKVSFYFQKDDAIMGIVLFFGILFTLICFYVTKNANGLRIGDYLFSAMAVLVICLMAASWQKYKQKAKEQERELQTYKLYEDSYQNLISDIRLRQHEFNNHISAIYSQHVICKSYEELVARQKEYCEEILYDNRYERLLKAGDSMMIGFLYGKFIEAEKRGIRVDYDIRCGELQSVLPMFKMIELMGNLFNNAMDALENREEKRLYVSIIENTEETVVEVRNVHETLSPKQIAEMFQKGYSSKGENRGLGLYGLKRMGKEYHFEIACSNILSDGENWVAFSVRLPRADL